MQPPHPEGITNMASKTLRNAALAALRQHPGEAEEALEKTHESMVAMVESLALDMTILLTILPADQNNVPDDIKASKAIERMSEIPFEVFIVGVGMLMREGFSRLTEFGGPALVDPSDAQVSQVIYDFFHKASKDVEKEILEMVEELRGLLAEEGLLNGNG